MYHITMFPYKFLNFWNPFGTFGLNTNVFGNFKIIYFCISGMVLIVRGGVVWRMYIYIYIWCRVIGCKAFITLLQRQECVFRRFCFSKILFLEDPITLLISYPIWCLMRQECVFLQRFCFSKTSQLYKALPFSSHTQFGVGKKLLTTSLVPYRMFFDFNGKSIKCV